MWTNRARDFVVTSIDSNELHYFAQTWNWTCGPGLLKDLLSNPNCDFGTALMIFWLARPEYYLQYADSTNVPDFELEGFEFLSYLEEKMVTGCFRAKTIRFDPTPEVGLYPESIAVAKRELPKMLYQQS